MTASSSCPPPPRWTPRTNATALALALALACAGCGSGSGSTPPSQPRTTSAPVPPATTPGPGQAATPGAGQATTAGDIRRQRIQVEGAFARRFRERFLAGTKKGFVHQPAASCRDVGVGEEGHREFQCQAWGSVPSAGGCILVTTEPVTVSGVPSLQAKHLQRGQPPFEPGSCRIGGRP